ncbi:hypothetical protein CONPUDRAFT_147908 [Coniophora puteana RWD-64-598 SS2]|uniref:Ubiquitin-like protease family profile domain-containing protein n=1 Tax=Coniophora puteana (strain RWD-64-598) TaxID=741705 RepID=R7SGB6_CONPW|nr:uncharacterized protein CONPUDRAFT_147908 [Coniophora puteana RWD-64-598 SS2]EIW74134.1 hypothetical protein CONPUDRAFT_147908 [Coniophora puteana RWD-64-598 SS2]
MLREPAEEMLPDKAWCDEAHRHTEGTDPQPGSTIGLKETPIEACTDGISDEGSLFCPSHESFSGIELEENSLRSPGLPTQETPGYIRTPLFQVHKEDIGASIMAQPVYWTTAFHGLETLRAGAWVDINVLTFYLASIWHEAHGGTHIRFARSDDVRITFVLEKTKKERNEGRKMQEQTEELVGRSSNKTEYCRRVGAPSTEKQEGQNQEEEQGEIIFSQPITPEFREQFDNHHYISNQICPVSPVGFLVHEGSHFFACVFDYLDHKAYVLGRNRPDNWNHREHYWHRVAELHRWDAGNPDKVTTVSVEWVQNGVDCGPTACEVLARCMIDGLCPTLSALQGTRPALICGHVLRLNILHQVYNQCVRSFQNFGQFRQRPPPFWSMDDTLISDEVEDLFSPHQSGAKNSPSSTTAAGHCFKEIVENLNHAISLCTSCLDSGTEPAFAQNRNSAPDWDKLKQDINDIRGARDKTFATSRASTNNLDHPIESEDSDDTEAEHGTLLPKLPRSVLKRFPRPKPLNVLPPVKGKQYFQHDRQFDDYESGPTIELIHRSELAFIYCPPFDKLKVCPVIDDWRDRGYRILASSFQNSFLQAPVQVLDHIMCTVPGYQFSQQVSNRATGKYRLRSQQEGSQVNVNDVRIMGAAEMLRLASEGRGHRGRSSSAQSIFVRGITGGLAQQKKNYVCVDLQLDRVDIRSKDIHISVDIDSLIWIGPNLIFKKSIGLQTIPTYFGGPAIPKRNHISIDLLIPQSAYDRAQPGGRTEWMSMPTEMNGIPHTQFGSTPSPSGQPTNILIFFPRMFHKNFTNHRSVNLMPHYVLDRFWDRVLIPALVKSFQELKHLEPYIPHTLKELKYKSRKADQGSSGNGKLLPIPSEVIMGAQVTMRKIINEDESTLGMFGSFFFALEAKGIKLMTVERQNGTYSDPVSALQESIPSLDWDQMRDRAKGELFLDIGVAFTPMRQSNAVTGLWWLEALEVSFGAGGFNAGSMHNHAMLSRVGAMQAPMSKDRQWQTGIISRSSYSLDYEAVRPRNNKPTFASDSDAYNLTQRYTEECNSLIEQLLGATGKTFGVRDEYRVTWDAAEAMLRNGAAGLKERGRQLMDSGSVIWVQTETWFRWNAMRVKSLQETQEALRRKNPPNLGIMTSLLTHMIRSTTYTPIVYDAHLSDSLKSLQQHAVMETCNMFFLHDLDISKARLKGVEEIDSDSVLRIMGKNAPLRRDQAIASQENELAAAERNDDSDYPLGKFPTWTDLKEFHGKFPWLLVKKWNPEIIDWSLRAVILFCTFTGHIWLMLSVPFLKSSPPRPSSVDDAMKCWTIHYVRNLLDGVKWEASNDALEQDGVAHGRPGPRSPSFANRMPIFFPPTSSPKHVKSQWDPLFQHPGYISQYHKLVESGKDNGAFSDLQKSLQEIFSSLECLPASEKMTVKAAGTVWKVAGDAFVFITNSRLYKVVGLSKDTRSVKATLRIPRVKTKHDILRDIHAYEGIDYTGDVKPSRRNLKNRAELNLKSKAVKNRRRPPVTTRSRGTNKAPKLAKKERTT